MTTKEFHALIFYKENFQKKTVQQSNTRNSITPPLNLQYRHELKKKLRVMQGGTFVATIY